MIVTIIFIVIFVSFFALFIGVLMAPYSINKNKLQEFENNKYEILRVPHMFMQEWYDEEKNTARKLIIYGLLTLIIGFVVLVILKKTAFI
jgi:purine-cytosine permease-like protein